MPSPENFKVSVYAIALNEERFIRRWYDCFKEADEICVLDTGSTDKTVDILRSLGAKVSVMRFDRWKTLEELDALTAAGKNPWRFDKARNEAMKLCSPDSTLLFCTDVDDVIEPGWKSRLEAIWRKGVEEGRKVGHLPNSVLYTYAVVYNQGADEQLQVFHRHNIHTPKGWHWQNRCHEVLESDGEPKNFVHAPEFRMESRPEAKDHSSYLWLLEADAREESKDGRIFHILAREYMQLGRNDEAIEMFQRHLSCKKADWNCERAASMKFMSDCYARKGDGVQQELWLWRAMIEDPLDRDASYTLGRILVKRKDYKLAQKVLLHCLKIEKPSGEFPFFSLDAWTERPYLSLVEAYFYDGKWPEALEVATTALLKFPKSAMAAKTVEEVKNHLAKGDANKVTEIPRFRIEIDN